MNKIKILVTGAGGSASIGFCRSLKDSETDYEIIGVDCDKYHLNLAEVDYRYLVPPVGDPDYIEILNYLVEKHEVVFLHSQPDVEIEFLSEHRDELNVKTNLPSKEAVRACINKWESYKRWKAAGIKVPETIFINNKSDLMEAFEKLSGTVWLRQISGAGGKGSLPTSDAEKACKWVDYCEGWGRFTAAELLSENTITWQSIWDHGDLVVAQTRARAYWEYGSKIPSGVTGITGTGITVDDKKTNDIALATILAIDSKPNGIFSVDMAYDFNGIPNPTEINIARFFTTHYFFTCAGANFPDTFVRMSLGLPIKEFEKKINPLPEGLVWVRGMDSKPALADLDRLTQFEKELKNLRLQARR
jgi:carbamoyl-phosphate synthase large subunit